MALRKIGDWERVGMMIKAIQPEMVRAVDISLKRFGLKLEGTAKKHISQQDLPWAPLSAKYIARKVKQGYSENILVRTSSYFQSITSWVSDDTVYIGVRSEARNKDGVVLANIAAVHEYGSKSGVIPARPLWKPSMEETMTWHLSKNRPEQIFLKNMEKYLR
jgi:hypothetical protein